MKPSLGYTGFKVSLNDIARPCLKKTKRGEMRGRGAADEGAAPPPAMFIDRFRKQLIACWQSGPKLAFEAAVIIKQPDCLPRLTEAGLLGKGAAQNHSLN